MSTIALLGCAGVGKRTVNQIPSRAEHAITGTGQGKSESLTPADNRKVSNGSLESHQTDDDREEAVSGALDDPSLHDIPADIVRRAAECGITISSIMDRIIYAVFERDVLPEEEELATALFDHITLQSGESHVAASGESGDEDNVSDGRQRSPSAPECVFAISELLDQIMSSVSAWDVVRCRRVSKCFLQHVSTSSVLLRKLCLFGGSSDELQHNELGPRCIKLSTIWASDTDVRKVIGHISVFSIKHIAETDALWRKMFVSQPPIYSLKLSSTRGVSEIEHIVRRKAGITFADLLSEAKAMVKDINPSVHPVSAGEDVISFSGPAAKKKRRGGCCAPKV